MFEGTLWPSDEDRLPRQALFHISKSPHTYPVNETPDNVEARLKTQYPLYKIAAFGAEILQKITQGGKS